MRKLTPKKYAASLFEALASVPEAKAGEVIAAFVRLLAKNKDLKKADKVVVALGALFDEKANIQQVELRSAEKLSQDVADKIISLLQASLHKEIRLSEQIDESLIGGVVLKYGDTVADGSLRKQLERMKQSIG